MLVLATRCERPSTYGCFLSHHLQIKVRSVTEGDAFLVLASDGVWEFMGNQEVRTRN